MKDEVSSRTGFAQRRRPVMLGFVASLALVVAACTQTPDPTTTTTTSTTTTVIEAPTLSVSKSAGLNPAGESITVTGKGFTTTGNLGTRPPLLGSPAGVYVVFGTFGENWRPSQGGGQRQVISQRWALIPSSFDTVAAMMGTSAELVQVDANGNFSVDVTVSSVDGTYDTIAIATYAGSGSVNAAEEFRIPLEFAAAS